MVATSGTTTTFCVPLVLLFFSCSSMITMIMCVMFGLVFSVLITLLLIPIMYYRKPGTVAAAIDDRIDEHDKTRTLLAVETLEDRISNL